MNQVIIVSAPSGSGKSTLVNHLKRREGEFVFSVSYTTRSPRGDEMEGREYHFVTRESFLAMRDRDEFVEWAQVFDDFYGTHRRYFDVAAAEKKDLLLDIDVQGAQKLRVKYPDAVSIFILAPSREELVKRLQHRGDVSEEVIRKRVAQSAREINEYSRYDYVVVNDDVDTATDRLYSIVKSARIRTRDAGVQNTVQGILKTFEQQ